MTKFKATTRAAALAFCGTRQVRYICVMNTRLFLDMTGVRTTQAAEGMLRRRFTVEELEAMVAVGILGEDERIELIGGEVVPKSPKGNRHEVLKHALRVLPTLIESKGIPNLREQ